MTLSRTPALATDCVVFDPLGRVLLIHEGMNPARVNMHSRGFVKIGETVMSACRREVGRRPESTSSRSPSSGSTPISIATLEAILLAWHS